MRARLLATLLLVCLLHLLLAPGVMLRGLSGALLTRASHASQTPVTGLRVFLRCRIGRLRFPGFMTMLVLASLHVWTWSLKLPWALFLGECSPHALSCDGSSGRGASPVHSERCLLQLLTRCMLTALRHAPHMQGSHGNAR